MDPTMEIELRELQQDMPVRNAALLHVVSVGLKELQEQFDSRSQWVDRAPQVTEPAGPDAEQAAEVEQMPRGTQQSTQDSGSGRQR